MRTERALQAYFIKECRQAGLLAYKVVCVGRRGFPDVVVVDDNGVYFIELKSPTGKGRVSPHQTEILNELRESNANVYIIASKADVDAFIRSRFNERPSS